MQAAFDAMLLFKQRKHEGWREERSREQRRQSPLLEPRACDVWIEERRVWKELSVNNGQGKRSVLLPHWLTWILGSNNLSLSPSCPASLTMRHPVRSEKFWWARGGGEGGGDRPMGGILTAPPGSSPRHCSGVVTPDWRHE
jgi:hypothetical protein